MAPTELGMTADASTSLADAIAVETGDADAERTACVVAEDPKKSRWSDAPSTLYFV